MTEMTGGFTPVGEGVFTAVAEPEAVNIGLVVGPDGCLVVDTGSSPEQGAQIRRQAELVAGVPVIAVLVTHWHYDHLFGLAAFSDVPSYAHESVAAWLDHPEGHAAATALGMTPADLVAPSHPFSLARAIDVGGRPVEAVHFGPGHTDGDVIAYVPDADVIFVGDLLESAGPPQFGADSHLRTWPSAVDGALGLVDENTTLIPGHGTPMDRLAAFTQRAEISGLYGQAEHLFTRGVKLEEAFAAGEWPFDEATVREVLPLAYRQLSDEGKIRRVQLPLAGH